MDKCKVPYICPDPIVIVSQNLYSRISKKEHILLKPIHFLLSQNLKYAYPIFHKNNSVQKINIIIQKHEHLDNNNKIKKKYFRVNEF